MFSHSKIRVAVLRGGQSPEYDVSLKTGATVLQHLPEKYDALDILIDKNGLWHLYGVPKPQQKILGQVDVVFNALHGGEGEDGRIQHTLQTHGIPFTGSQSFASALGINKILSKEIFLKNNLKTPTYTTVKEGADLSEQARTIFKTFLMPAIVKPVTAGSSVGTSIAQSIAELEQAINLALQYSREAIIEEYIRGKEASCGVVENFRDEVLHALMPIEIRQKDEICPGNFSVEEKKAIEDYACRAHQALGLRHYSQSDFIVTPRRGVYILETNTLPELTEQSLFPKALTAGGTPLSHFLDHVLQLAMR